MSFIDHLEALRWHIVRSLLAIMVGAVAAFFFRDWLFDNVVMGPTQNNFISYRFLCDFSRSVGFGDALCMPPMKMEVQSTTVSGPFMSALTISFFIGLLAAFPYVCWEVWRFIRPALKPEELKHTRGIIFWVTLFFLIGAAFGYFLIAPFTFNFLANFQLGTTGKMEYRPMLSDYLTSIIDITLGAGLAFELPMASWVMARMGILTAGFLRTYRKYAYVFLLVIAAIITPSPDWGSQLIVCVPLVLLYELSIIIAARVNKKRDKEWAEWS